MVWFGGLTGVQARLQVENAQALIQREGDDQFHSVFIANMDSGIQPIDEITGLEALIGRSFTFGSESYFWTSAASILPKPGWSDFG